MQTGWFINPIFTEQGDYPQVMIDKIAANSIKEGRESSRLPVMSEDMRKSLIGSADFLAINYYTSRLIAPLKRHSHGVLHLHDKTSFPNDVGLEFTAAKNWKKSNTSDWLFENPEGLYHGLKWIKDHFDVPKFTIAENGYSDDGKLQDDDRVLYIQSHLHWISKAIEDGCNVVEYTVWSLIDNFEWLSGYKEKFGVFRVEFDKIDQPRIPRSSAKFLKRFIDDEDNFTL